VSNPVAIHAPLESVPVVASIGAGVVLGAGVVVDTGAGVVVDAGAGVGVGVGVTFHTAKSVVFATGRMVLPGAYATPVPSARVFQPAKVYPVLDMPGVDRLPATDKAPVPLVDVGGVPVPVFAS
jgi:hypothetical protein